MTDRKSVPRNTYDVTASTTEFRGAVLTLRVDEVKMPGGRTAKREVVEHCGAVSVVAVREDGAVAMIEQYRHPVGQRMWELPGGLRDVEGEDPEISARRELWEEAGITAETVEPLVEFYTSPGFSTEHVSVYLARGLSESAAPEREHEEAEIDLRWWPLADAVAAITQRQIVNAIAVSGLFAAQQVLHGGAGT